MLEIEGLDCVLTTSASLCSFLVKSIFGKSQNEPKLWILLKHGWKYENCKKLWSIVHVYKLITDIYRKTFNFENNTKWKIFFLSFIECILIGPTVL